MKDLKIVRQNLLKSLVINGGNNDKCRDSLSSIGRLLDIMQKETSDFEKRRIIKWAEDYMKAQWRECGTDKHGVALKDLINFLK